MYIYISSHILHGKTIMTSKLIKQSKSKHQLQNTLLNTDTFTTMTKKCSNYACFLNIDLLSNNSSDDKKNLEEN